MTKKSIFRAFMLMVIGFGVSGTFVSCTQIDRNDSETSPIVGKWEVSDSQAEYASFEFTGDSKYIIIRQTTTPAGTGSSRANQSVYITVIFGDYSALSTSDNSFSLNLKDFGTITITMYPASGTATITVSGRETYTASKSEKIYTDEKTELFCHTWTFSKYEIIENLVPAEYKQWLIENYGSITAYEQEENDHTKGMTVTFTNTGTYFVNNPNPRERTFIMAHWGWENISNGILNYYKLDDGEEWNGEWEGSASVTELTAHTCKIIEDYMVTALTR